ncbi:Transcriptional repressor TUP1 [Neolecta irregularis DAH-3]|uniref:Transcriptional repressor TUP1 n=1 Tax=Neolecta irregularis (strain DAH-3) TaxID=1198029 RepID=A0A1U7LGE9_NEOID|nr:Transcriptional repressor TUP1 [Neolecta irregularis DAH-3]|eukprot:OLL21673.1 Transcriptional repressor TUP1 [Neolecta irregularis DAH-3]
MPLRLVLFDPLVSLQISEVQSIRQTVVELEMSHQKLKQQYNEEIKRLQRELDAARTAPPVQPIAPGPSSSNNNHHISHASVPPTLSHGQNNLFGPIMAGQGGQAGQLAPPDASLQSNQQYQGPPPGPFQNGQPQQQHQNKRIRTEQPSDASQYEGRKGSAGSMRAI